MRKTILLILALASLGIAQARFGHGGGSSLDLDELLPIIADSSDWTDGSTVNAIKPKGAKTVEADSVKFGALEVTGNARFDGNVTMVTTAGEQVQLGTGSDAAPELSSVGDTNAGIRFPGNDIVSINTDGIRRLDVTKTGLITTLSSDTTAKMTITGGSSKTDDVGIKIAGTYSSNTAHSVQVNSTHPLAEGNSVAFFDAKGFTSGSANLNHIAAVQSRATHGSSGTLLDQYDWYGTFTNSGGLVSNRYGLYVANPTGSGNITNNYGLYIEDMAKGIGHNYAIYSAGTADTSYIAGNLGIGTTTPAYSLDVSKSSATAVAAQVKNYATGTGSYAAFNLAVTGSKLFSYQFGSNYTTSGRFIKDGSLIEASGGGGLGLNASNASGNIMFYTESVERMRIANTTGNLGLGTTTPQAKLSVVGTDGTGTGLHIISSDVNKLRTTWTQATDSASVTIRLDSNGDPRIGLAAADGDSARIHVRSDSTEFYSKNALVLDAPVTLIGGSNVGVSKIDTVFTETFVPRWLKITSGAKSWYSPVYADTTGKW
jgi:hypothetical protein